MRSRSSSASRSRHSRSARRRDVRGSYAGSSRARASRSEALDGSRTGTERVHDRELLVSTLRTSAAPDGPHVLRAWAHRRLDDAHVSAVRPNRWRHRVPRRDSCVRGAVRWILPVPWELRRRAPSSARTRSLACTAAASAGRSVPAHGVTGQTSTHGRRSPSAR